MSLIEPNLSNVVKKQYAFKLQAFFGTFASLASIQILSILFSIGGVGSSGYGTAGLTVIVTYYSADFIIAGSMFWAFITGILITTRAARYDDFMFVSNRLTSNLANLLFLMTGSVIAGVSTILAGFLQKNISYFFGDSVYGEVSTLFQQPKEVLVAVIATTLYVFLFSMLGYLVGMIIQKNRAFIFLLPGLFTGLIVLGGISNEEAVKAVFNFIFHEPSLLLFFIKVLIVAAVFFTGATALSNRMEVRI